MTDLALIDNMVLTNFALVNRPDLFQTLWGEACATTLAVIAEYRTGVDEGLLPDLSWDGLQRLDLSEVEASFAAKLPAQLGSGERTCLAACVYRQALFVSDDRRARQVARQCGIALTGSIGILLQNVRTGFLSLPQGNDLLAAMIRFGYYAPVVTLDHLLKN